MLLIPVRRDPHGESARRLSDDPACRWHQLDFPPPVLFRTEAGIEGDGQPLVQGNGNAIEHLVHAPLGELALPGVEDGRARAEGVVDVPEVGVGLGAAEDVVRLREDLAQRAVGQD